jgi:mycothiol system anti-sigma-R factor
MNCDEARELITGLVDDELTCPERSLIEDHLEDCSRCSGAYEQEQSLKREIHRVGASMSAPADLKRKILTNYGLLPNDSESPNRWPKLAQIFRPFRRPAFALALLLIVLLPIIYVMQPHGQAISLAALEIQEKIATGGLSLRKATSQNELRDWQTRAVDGKFAPMEYDLSSMHVQPVGGVVQEIDGRKILATVYTGKNISVTCFTFLGTEQDAPRDATVFHDRERNINFYMFSRNGYNAVLHREGEVICILMSDMPAEKLLAVATGKADKA